MINLHKIVVTRKLISLVVVMVWCAQCWVLNTLSHHHHHHRHRRLKAPDMNEWTRVYLLVLIMVKPWRIAENEIAGKTKAAKVTRKIKARRIIIHVNVSWVGFWVLCASAIECEHERRVKYFSLMLMKSLENRNHCVDIVSLTANANNRAVAIAQHSA